MKNAYDSSKRPSSPLFCKTAREWMLASALYDGIEDKDIRQIEILLTERGANPNVLLAEYGITPFHLVVANENIRFAVQATDLCLQHGADPNVRSEDGLTPVHLAAMWGCSEVLQVLLASGGDPWLVDSLKLNAFDYAQREGQRECYNILKVCCNSQPKPSGSSKSPYKLNLKRVILYKNDLQIVYEASPSSSVKSSSTQTSPHPRKSDQLQDLLNGFNKPGRVSSKDNEKTYSLIEENDILNYLVDDKLTNRNNKENCIATHKGSENTSELSCNLKEMILRHRRNTTVFEHSPQEKEDSFISGLPSGGETDSFGNRLPSWRETKVSGSMVGSVSQLVEKLEFTNKIRQSFKSNGNKDDMLRNVTQRKKSSETEPVSPTSQRVSVGVTANMKSYQNKSVQNSQNFISDSSRINFDTAPSCSNTFNGKAQNDIGFVFNTSNESPNNFSKFQKPDTSYNFESPPNQTNFSIGFVLDNLGDSFERSRGSSLFSDISSDVEVSTPAPPKLQKKDNIFTEDETSSADSLYPYVSCDSVNTRENDSSEEFKSCFEKSNQSNMTPKETEVFHSEEYNNKVVSLDNIVDTDVNSVVDSILKHVIEDENCTTPVNPEIVSSTPERLSGGSEDGSLKSDVKKKGWVEAKVALSDEDEPYMSISEEYEYTDLDEGVVLIERHYLKDDGSVSTSHKKRSTSAMPSSTSEESDVSTISGSEGAYDTDELRRALLDHGFTAGPITGNTKRVYLRKLKRCKQKPDPPPQSGQPAYSLELLRTLSNTCEHLVHEWAHLEDSMSASFTCMRRQWREGQTKTSFTYLLLDPRIAHNLPARASSIAESQLWADFLRAIFYIGKGKRSRPYAHLYKAVGLWQQQSRTSSKKIERILDIWNSGQGVVCLHVFLNIIPVEAFTREAAMISAITLKELTNEKAGEFYGSAASWSLRLKRRLGCVLLNRAFKVYLAEGERQLRPVDID